MLKKHLSGYRVITPQRSALRQNSLNIFIHDLDIKNGTVLNVITSSCEALTVFKKSYSIIQGTFQSIADNWSGKSRVQYCGWKWVLQ